MIIRTQTIIHLKEGVTVTLLLTPALYGVAKERGIEILSDILRAKDEDSDERVSHTVDAYSKIAYCAAISNWEVECVDNPEQGEFPYSYKDFYTWAWQNPREFGKTVQDILVALTGKTVREYLAEQKTTGVEPEKKKTQTRKTLLSRIGRLWKRSSSGAAE